MRAISPIETTTLTLEGFRVGYERFGDPNAPAVLLLPTWQIVHRGIWKMQVPFLARRYQVITFDQAGNGLGERTTDPAAFEYDRIVDQALGVLDHLKIETAHVMGFGRGTAYGVSMAAWYSRRVRSLVLLANGVDTSWPPWANLRFWEPHNFHKPWTAEDSAYWAEHYPQFIRFFFGEIIPDPHSTKALDDCFRWAMETTPEILLQTVHNNNLYPKMSAAEAVKQVRCPVLVLHGQDAYCDPFESSQSLTEMRPDWEFVTFENCGEVVHLRYPVRVNLLIADFLRRVEAG